MFLLINQIIHLVSGFINYSIKGFGYILLSPFRIYAFFRKDGDGVHLFTLLTALFSVFVAFMVGVILYRSGFNDLFAIGANLVLNCIIVSIELQIKDHFMPRLLRIKFTPGRGVLKLVSFKYPLSEENEMYLLDLEKKAAEDFKSRRYW